MGCNLEFVRGNQNSFIRISLLESDLCSYEFQMCIHNVIKSILPFQKRNQNGEEFIYYDVSGTQSLDILFQTEKLKRPLMICLAKALLKLCHNLKEYALSIESVAFNPKYIMYRASAKEIQFVYMFQTCEGSDKGLEHLLEYCIDYLDYDDSVLADGVFQLCESLQTRGYHFSLENELEVLLEHLTEKSSENKTDDIFENWTEFATSEVSQEIINKEETDDTESFLHKKWKRYLLILLCIDICSGFLWQPITILKIFFVFSFGAILFGLYLYVDYLERHRQNCIASKKDERTYIKEYEEIVSNSTAPEDGTQFISIENMNGMLYNLQGIRPQYIYITEKAQLIGKEKDKVQVYINADGISRVHAKIVQDKGEYLIEDLCSTNGTRINGKCVEPRRPYALKEGDKVCFAAAEYIFR